MTTEEYKEKILHMLEDIADNDMLRKIYTVTKVLYEFKKRE